MQILLFVLLFTLEKPGFQLLVKINQFNQTNAKCIPCV